MHKYFNKRNSIHGNRLNRSFWQFASDFPCFNFLHHTRSFSGHGKKNQLFFSSLSAFPIFLSSIFHVNAKHLPLLQTLLSSSSGPLESLSSSCRCKWLCWLKWWWFSPRLWCKWCKWLLLLFAADALRSRGFSGDGDRPPFSTCSRLRWSAAPTLAAPPPPKMSLIMKRDRDGSTAIDPRCIGTVIVKPLTAATFADNNSAVLVIVDDFGLTPDECHWSTILMKFTKTWPQTGLDYQVSIWNCLTASCKIDPMPNVRTLARVTPKKGLFSWLLSSKQLPRRKQFKFN